MVKRLAHIAIVKKHFRIYDSHSETRWPVLTSISLLKSHSEINKSSSLKHQQGHYYTIYHIHVSNLFEISNICWKRTLKSCLIIKVDVGL